MEGLSHLDRPGKGVGVVAAREDSWTYRSKARNLPREPCLEIFGNAFKVKRVLGKHFSVVLLPLSNGLKVLRCRSLNVLCDFQRRPSITSRHELSLKCSRLSIDGALLKNPAFCRGMGNPPARCGRLHTRDVFLHHLPLLWRLILLLRDVGLSSWPFRTVNKGSVRGVGGIRNVSQWCSRTTGRHSDESVMGRRWYEYSSCHS
jgi:hypothetical protein